MPSTMCDAHSSKLFAALQESKNSAPIVSIPRKFFSEERGWYCRRQGGQRKRGNGAEHHHSARPLHGA